MGSQTDSVIPFAPAARSAGADGVDQVDKAGHWDCFTKQLALPKQIVSMRSTWLRRFPISFEQPKIGSPNSRLRSACIRRKPTARSSGYIECTLRLRTDFSDKTTVVEDRLNAGRVSTVRVDWRVELKEGGDRPLASSLVR